MPEETLDVPHKPKQAIPRRPLPKLSIAQIINMSLGFMGIQFGFALQNANASRILSTFGADVEHLSWFWLAAPVTGFIVQPIIGHYSDQTWNKYGRRRPYFLVGALLASIALVFMPNSGALAGVIPAMFIGAGMLMIMDASINVSMEPFRALVADMLPSDQRTLGFSIQTALIGIGAVVGSWLPYVLAEFVGVSGEAGAGEVPDNVIFSFYVGAAAFMTTIIWTVVTTKEYPPEEYAAYHGDEGIDNSHSFFDIFKNIGNMPKTMKQLAVVQFFSWFGLFTMWVFTTNAISQSVWGVPAGLDMELAENKTYKDLFDEAGNWVGIMFGLYNLISAFFALLLPYLAKLTSRKTTHSISLIIGGISLISLYFIKDQNLLLIPMIGVGIVWASILAMPYAMLAGSIPPGKMGIYMGIFNFFIVIPQIINGIIGGPIVKNLFDSNPIYYIMIGGIFFLIAAIAVRFVDDEDDPVVA